MFLIHVNLNKLYMLFGSLFFWYLIFFLHLSILIDVSLVYSFLLMNISLLYEYITMYYSCVPLTCKFGYYKKILKWTFKKYYTYMKEYLYSKTFQMMVQGILVSWGPETIYRLYKNKTISLILRHDLPFEFSSSPECRGEFARH